MIVGAACIQTNDRIWISYFNDDSIQKAIAESKSEWQADTRKFQDFSIRYHDARDSIFVA
jgi:hypothetical protein